MEKQIDIDISNFNKTKDVNIFDKILSYIGLELIFYLQTFFGMP